MRYVNMGIIGVWGAGDDQKCILIVLIGRKIFWMMASRVFWGNHSGRRNLRYLWR